MISIWLCRCGTKGEYEEQFLEKNIIGVELEGLSKYVPASDFKELKRRVVLESDDEAKKKMLLSRLFTMSNKIATGDVVLTPSVSNRNEIHIGTIEGEAAVELDAALKVTRPVRWLSKINRHDIDKNTLGSMGSAISVFKVKASEEFQTLISSAIKDPN